MRYVIHLKPLESKRNVKQIVAWHAIVGTLHIAEFSPEFHPHKRMISFKAPDDSSIPLIMQQHGKYIAAILPDNHGMGKYKRPRCHKNSLHASALPLSPLQVAQVYNFPPITNHLKAKVVAILELGGGFKTLNILNYCKQLGVPFSQIYFHSVLGAANAPDGPDGADGEVSLDVNIVAAVAPGCKILVVMAPNTTNGFIDAVACLPTYGLKPDVVSISWGMPETIWHPAARQAMDNAIQSCVNAGMNIFVASGDDGSSDGMPIDTVDYPASNPNAIACGGTRLTLNPDGTRRSEVIWNELASGNGAGGGGVSTIYPGRIVPDIAGNADPETGYIVNIDGETVITGGTSAVAPLMSALAARLAGNLDKPLGQLLPILHQNPQTCYDITSGNNGSYKAKPGIDSCSGLGVPDGMKLLAVLKGQDSLPKHILQSGIRLISRAFRML